MSNSRGRAPSAAAAGVPAVMTRTELAALTTAEKSQHKHPAHFEGTKVIVVGVGLWGSNIAREAYHQNALAAIVDPCEAAMTHLLEALEKPVDVPKFRTLHEALSKVQSSPVVVATPPKTHFEVAMAAIVAHRDVWVEKPVCTSVGDAQRLVAAAKKNDVILFVDHLMHYNLAHEKLLRLVGAGWVGEITRVRAKRLNFGRVRIAENVLWSFCPHDVSLIIAICGGRLPVSVYCVGQSVVSSDIEDYVDLHLEFPGGIRASLEANWLHYEKERRMEVFGRSGCIVVNESCKELRKPELQGFKWSTKRNRDGSSVAIDKSEQDMMGYLAGTASMVTPNTVAGAVTDAPSGAEGAGAAADAAASVSASGGVNAASGATAHGAAGASVATTAAPVLGNGAATEQAATGNTTDLKSTPLQTAMQHFLKCCKTRETPRTDGVEGLNVLKVLVAAQESLKKKRAVVLDGVEKKRVESSNMYFKHPTAVVDSGAHIGEHTRIWHFSHIMGGARLGKGCNIGQNVYIGGKVILGNNVKVQNGVSIYDGVTVDDDAFLGPHCVFTNIKTPRSHINRRKEYLSTWVGRGASIGANATLMCGISLSDYCLVGAGSVVTKNVPSHAMVYGNPAVIKGWVSTTGNGLVVVAKIGDGRRILQCPESKEVYTLFPAPRAGADPHIVREVGDDEQK